MVNFQIFENDMQSAFAFGEFQKLSAGIPIFPHKNEYDDSKIEPDYAYPIGELIVNLKTIT